MDNVETNRDEENNENRRALERKVGTFSRFDDGGYFDDDY